MPDEKPTDKFAEWLYSGLFGPGPLRKTDDELLGIDPLSDEQRMTLYEPEHEPEDPFDAGK